MPYFITSPNPERSAGPQTVAVTVNNKVLFSVSSDSKNSRLSQALSTFLDSLFESNTDVHLGYTGHRLTRPTDGDPERPPTNPPERLTGLKKVRWARHEETADLLTSPDASEGGFHPPRTSMNRLAQSNSTSLLSELRGPAPGVMTFREGLPFAGLPPPPPLARGVLKSSCESPPSVIFNPESEEKFDTTVHSDFLSAPHLFYTLNELVVLSPPLPLNPGFLRASLPNQRRRAVFCLVPFTGIWPRPPLLLRRCTDCFSPVRPEPSFKSNGSSFFYSPSSLPFLSPSPRFYAG